MRKCFTIVNVFSRSYLSLFVKSTKKASTASTPPDLKKFEIPRRQASSKEAIAAATKEAVSDAQIQVGVSIGGAVQKALNDSLHATQSKLDALQQRADKLGGQFVDERARKYNFILTGCLAVSIVMFVCFGVVGSYRYQTQIDSLKSDLDSANKMEIIGLKAIPQKYQDQFFAAQEASTKN